MAESLIRKYRASKSKKPRTPRTNMTIKLSEGSAVGGHIILGNSDSTFNSDANSSSGKRPLSPEIGEEPRKRSQPLASSGAGTYDSQRASPTIGTFIATWQPQSASSYTFSCSGRSISFEKTNPEVSQPGVIDLNSDFVSASLTAPEKLELQDPHPLPKFREAFRYSFDRFHPDGKHTPTTADELWQIILNSSPLRKGVSYNRADNADAIYVNQSAASILTMIQNLESCRWNGSRALQEGWYAANVWAPLVDQCFLTIDNCCLCRTEIKSCVDFSENRRFDGIVCAYAGHEVAEFGGIEVSKDPDMIPSDKADLDMEKLVVVMECMLAKLLQRVDGKMEYGKKLRVVGIQHVGFSIRILRMHALNPTVFVVQRGPKRVVPIETANFDVLLQIMKSIVMVKGIVEESMKVITDYVKRSGIPRNMSDQFEDFDP